jgi:sugar diacid utilization regulator
MITQRSGHPLPIRQEASMKKRKSLASLGRLLKCDDLQSMIDAARPMLPNPLILTDLTHKLLAISNDEISNDSHWIEIRTHGGIPLNIPDEPAIAEAYSRSQREGRAVLDERPAPETPMLRRVLSARGKVIGYLDSPGNIEPFDESDIAVFDILGDLCALHMATHMHYGNPSENLLEYFIGDLISGRLTDPYLITERVEHFKWNIPKEMRIVTAHEASDLLDTQIFTKTQQIRERIANIFPDLTIFIFGRDIKILLPAGAGKETDTNLTSRLRDALEKEDMHAGVSRKFSSMTDFFLHDVETLAALELGAMIHPDERLHFYDKYAVFHMIDMLNEQVDATRFCHSDVLALHEHDRLHNGELATTLRYYLSAGRNLADAAARLGIHRNTMRHRIQKIRELIDSDPEDPETAAAMLMSFCILQHKIAAPHSKPIESVEIRSGRNNKPGQV